MNLTWGEGPYTDEACTGTDGREIHIENSELGVIAPGSWEERLEK